MAQRSRTRSAKKKLKIIPLGGLHEIGKNLTVIEYGDDILLIDCGMAFPDDDMFGIDVVIPDFTYLRENMSKIKGLIITHAHEDHIGAVQVLFDYVNKEKKPVIRLIPLQSSSSAAQGENDYRPSPAEKEESEHIMNLIQTDTGFRIPFK